MRAIDEFCSRAQTRTRKEQCTDETLSEFKGHLVCFLHRPERKRRYIPLKTKDRKIAEQIANQIVPHELARMRDPIHKEVVRYLDDKAELRSPNWTRDGGHVLRASAAEMMVEHNCSCVQEIDTGKLQRWFYAKARTVKVATAAAYIFHVQHFLKWCHQERRIVLFNAAMKVKISKHTKAVRRNFLSLKPTLNCLV